MWLTTGKFALLSLIVIKQRLDQEDVRTCGLFSPKVEISVPKIGTYVCTLTGALPCSRLSNEQTTWAGKVKIHLEHSTFKLQVRATREIENNHDLYSLPA